MNDRGQGGYTIYCKKCGTSIRDGAAFCPICGNKIDETKPNFQCDYGNTNYTQTKKKSYAAIMIATSILAAAVIFALLISVGDIPVSSGDKQAKQQYDTVTTALIEKPAEEPGYMDEITQDELLDYFCDVALNIEFGGVDGVVKRWDTPIRVQVTGDYTAEDYATLEEQINKLNELGTLPDISLKDSSVNCFVYFVPLDEMDDVIPGYTEGNYGYFFLYWDGSYVINKAYIGIATDVTSQSVRNHLILEEFTQSLGLTDDSNKYKDSIFQAEWTQTQTLCDIDWELIRMLYNNDIHAGMKKPDVIRALAGK